MKVLHLCQRDDPAEGGAARVAVELVRRASPGTEALCVFVYGKPGVYDAELPGRCRYLGLTTGRQALKCAFRLWRLLQKEKPDIIHHHDGLTWTHMVSGLWPNALCVGHGHLLAPSPSAPWRHGLASWVQRRTYDHMICVSPSVAAAWMIAGIPDDRISIVPNGVDMDVFQVASSEQRLAQRARFGVPAEALVVGYVGRLHNEVKCCDDFVRMLAALPDFAWGLMAGSGPDLEQLKTLAAELGVAHRLKFLGLLNPAASCYQASDVFMLTSCYEPFGLVVLEAAACGIPVAGFEARGGVKELLDCVNAVVPESRSPLAMAKAVLHAKEQWQNLPDQRNVVSGRIRLRYSWASVVKETEGVYSRVLLKAARKLPNI